MTDERVGRGRTVAFSFEPNFRAFTDGTHELLRTAILGEGRRGGDDDDDDDDRLAARAAARQVRSAHSPVQLTVDPRGAAAARAILRRHGQTARRTTADGRVTFTVATRAAGADELPWTREVARDLRREGVPVVMYRVP